MVLPSVIRRVATASVVVLSLGAGSAQLALAQGGGGGQPPRPPENLKFFPKDTPRDTLLTYMRGFTYALGVNCAFCHVEEPATQPGGRPQLRPALDDKTEKQTARFMLAMVDTLNRITLSKVPQRHEAVRITCVTCHRGSPLPGTIETVITDAVDQFGPDSAIARYRKLRETPTNGRYDFGEFPLSVAARTLADRGKTDAAVAILTMSQEFNPASADIDLQLGGITRRSGTRTRPSRTIRPHSPNGLTISESEEP